MLNLILSYYLQATLAPPGFDTETDNIYRQQLRIMSK